MIGKLWFAIVTFHLLGWLTLVWADADPGGIVRTMEEAYGRVGDYRTLLVIKGLGGDESFRGVQKLLYTFKKPNKIRLDYEYPHRGMVVVFPDSGGKVAIRPPLFGGMLKLHLDPGSDLLEISPGQQIHETDLGVLIRNIAHTVTDMYLGDLKVTEESGYVRIHVLSDNPFRPGVPTRYVFTIDRRLSLPVAVRESTADNVLQRTVSYENLKLNSGIPDSVFSAD